jgi:TolA-binding protein
MFAMSLKEAPTRREALQMHATIVGLAAQMNDAKRVVDNLKLMVNSYARPKSPWRRENKGPIGKRAETQVEGMVFDFSTGLDRQGREQNNAAFLDGARELYLLYQKAFPKSKRLYDIKTLYGELLFAQKQYLPAARYILALIKKEPRGKATKELAEVMVTAAQSAVDADKTKYTIPEPGTALAELTLPPIKQTYAECLDLFVKLMPGNPQAGAMIFAAGGVYFDFGHYDEAIKHYYEYLRRFPNGDFIKNAAYSILLYYTKDQDEKKLKEAKSRIGANPALRQAPELAVFFQAPDKPVAEGGGKGKKGKKPGPSGDGGDPLGDGDGGGGGDGNDGAEPTDVDMDSDFGD